MKCNTCANERYCYDDNHQLTRDSCADNGFAAYTPITNADRIRAMSNEELAEWLFQAWHNSWYTLQEWIDWLKAPVEVDE